MKSMSSSVLRTDFGTKRSAIKGTTDRKTKRTFRISRRFRHCCSWTPRLRENVNSFRRKRTNVKKELPLPIKSAILHNIPIDSQAFFLFRKTLPFDRAVRNNIRVCKVQKLNCRSISLCLACRSNRQSERRSSGTSRNSLPNRAHHRY